MVFKEEKLCARQPVVTDISRVGL